jgi:hypothetical protein
MDDFIDVAHLVDLDEYVTRRVSKRVGKNDVHFNTGSLTRKSFDPKRPGSKIIYLSRSIRPYKYTDLDKPELWEKTGEAVEFDLLMDFISKLPFKETARMMIIRALGLYFESVLIISKPTPLLNAKLTLFC